VNRQTNAARSRRRVGNGVARMADQAAGFATDSVAAEDREALGFASFGPYFISSTMRHGFGSRRERQLLITFWRQPKASASLLTPPSFCSARSKMSITAEYHLSGHDVNTTVTHDCDSLENMAETIAERLKRLRKTAGLTQAQLADAVGVTQSAIGNIETGLRDYGASVVGIAKVLGTTPAYLMLEAESAHQASDNVPPDYAPAVQTTQRRRIRHRPPDRPIVPLTTRRQSSRPRAVFFRLD
jgi:transcriptional regulator with XRE-family HTH domain